MAKNTSCSTEFIKVQ